MLEVYDPETDAWTTKAPMPTARAATAAGVVNGVLYIAGGDSRLGTGGIVTPMVEAYDPATNTWTTKVSMPTARAGGASGVIDGVLYVIGGDNGIPLSVVEAYDPAANTWTTKAPIPNALASPASGVINGTLYLASCLPTDDAVGIVEAYTPCDVTWSSSNTTVATISASGWVTAVASGSAVISATSAGVTATTTLTVLPRPNNP
jgi:hypothetical protein